MSRAGHFLVGVLICEGFPVTAVHQVDHGLAAVVALLGVVVRRVGSLVGHIAPCFFYRSRVGYITVGFLVDRIKRVVTTQAGGVEV